MNFYGLITDRWEALRGFASHDSGPTSGDRAQYTGSYVPYPWNFGPSQQYQDQPTRSTENLDGLDPSLITEQIRLQDQQFSADVDSTLYGDSGAILTSQFLTCTSTGEKYQSNEVQRESSFSASSPSGPHPLLSAVPRSVPNVSSVGHGRQAYYAGSVDSSLDLQPIDRLNLPSAIVSQAQNQPAQPHALSPSQFEIICPECEADTNCRRKIFKGPNRKNTLRKHMREQHSGRQFERYKCLLLNQSGSSCLELIKSAQNLRRHVIDKHPNEACELPRPDLSMRRPNHVANAKLTAWFEKVPIQQQGAA